MKQTIKLFRSPWINFVLAAMLFLGVFVAIKVEAINEPCMCGHTPCTLGCAYCACGKHCKKCNSCTAITFDTYSASPIPVGGSPNPANATWSCSQCGAGAPVAVSVDSSQPGHVPVTASASCSGGATGSLDANIWVAGVNAISSIRPHHVLLDVLAASNGDDTDLVFPGDSVEFHALPTPTDVSFSDVIGGQFLWYETNDRGEFANDISKEAVSWVAPIAGEVTCNINVDYGVSPNVDESQASVALSIVGIKATVFARDLLPIENNAVFDDHHDIGYIITHSGNWAWEVEGTIGHFADDFNAAAAGYISWVDSLYDPAVGWVDGSVGNNLSGTTAGDPLYQSSRTISDYEEGLQFMQNEIGPKPYHLKLYSCQDYANDMFINL